MGGTVFVRLAAILIGLAMAGIGGWMAAAGHAHGDGKYLRQSRYEVPHARSLVRKTDRLLNKLPREYRAYFNRSETGMLYPLGGGGALLAFFGAVIFLNGAFRRVSSDSESEGVVTKQSETRIADELVKAPPKPKSAPKGGVISIDEAIIDEEDDESEKMRDINHLVTISQGAMEPSTVALTVRMFRPDLEQYLPLFNEKSADKFAHQILSSVILRHRRHSQEITADQFQTQDTRIIECERETFCHRYMPPAAKIVSAAIRERVGRVYDSFARSTIQKEVAGEADDWTDISLRNAAEVLAAKPATDQAA